MPEKNTYSNWDPVEVLGASVEIGGDGVYWSRKLERYAIERDHMYLSALSGLEEQLLEFLLLHASRVERIGTRRRGLARLLLYASRVKKGGEDFAVECEMERARLVEESNPSLVGWSA